MVNDNDKYKIIVLIIIIVFAVFLQYSNTSIPDEILTLISTISVSIVGISIKTKG